MRYLFYDDTFEIWKDSIFQKLAESQKQIALMSLRR